MKWILLILFLVPLHLLGQDSVRQQTVTLSGYVSEMPGLQYSSLDKSYAISNMLLGRLNFRWQPGTNFNMALETRGRFNFYNDYALPTVDFDAFEKNAGLVGLSKNIFTGKNYLFNISIDRLWADYAFKKWQFTLGRQRINWGQTFVWNPNDIFNTYNYLDFDYPEKPGSDALRIQYYTSETAKAELVIKTDSSRKTTVVGLYRFNRWNYDIQFISGITSDNDLVLGGGWSGQLANGGFRGEMSYFIPEQRFTFDSAIFTSSIGWDYTFKNSLLLQFECLYNGNHSDSNSLRILPNNAFRISAKNPFLGGFSYFASASYPITPLLNGSLATIVNPQNKVGILIPSVDYNLLENLDVTLLAQLIGFKFISQKYSTLGLWYLRLKYTF